MIEFTSIEQMLDDTRAAGLPLWDNIRRSDCQRQGIGPEESWRRMAAMLTAMVQADESYRESDRSHSGLVGGDGLRMRQYAAGGVLSYLVHHDYIIRRCGCQWIISIFCEFPENFC